MKLTGKVCAFRIALGFFMLFGLAGYAFGQDATIVGTIVDPSSAAVPNVTVTVTNTDTGQVRHVTSSDVGQYVVPDLQIGHYTIRAEVQGSGTEGRQVERCRSRPCGFQAGSWQHPRERQRGGNRSRRPVGVR